MSQITRDIVEGVQCSGCGRRFVEEHGYPVLCASCWKYTEPRERLSLQRATEREWRGDA
jgi:hypothetical protein